MTVEAELRFELLTHRTRAILRAVGAGRVQISLSCEPDMFVDGLACCDQVIARGLAHAGLVRPARPGSVGQRVPAVLTPRGADRLAAEPTAA